MRPSPLQPAVRRGFTLIELLVVIAIIGVLMSLLMSAIFKAYITAEKTRNRVDIMQLDAAVNNFYSDRKFYPPSQLKLLSNINGAAAGLDADSAFYLGSMFRLSASSPAQGWGGASGTTLQGDQCLVFFLGGISGNTGFSSNMNDPSSAGGDRVGKYFEFKQNRLKTRAGSFPSYLDTFGTNYYAYFSSYKSDNGYNRYGSSDCAGLGVAPYASSAGQYVNSGSFQIISAGKDGAFGSGSSVTGGAPFWAPGSFTGNNAWRDDQANFAGNTLSSGK